MHTIRDYAQNDTYGIIHETRNFNTRQEGRLDDYSPIVIIYMAKKQQKSITPVEKTIQSVVKKVKKEVEQFDFKKMASELGAHLKTAKAKFDAMDPKTKKKLVATLSVATALLVTTHEIKKAVKKTTKATGK